jgi:Delta7-sterol 5-desaturase
MDFEPWLNAIKKISSKYFIFASIAFVVFYVLFPKAFQKIKIQKLFPKAMHYYRDIFFSIISMLIFATIAYVCLALLEPYNTINYGSVHNYFFYALSFVWMFFLHDAYFYWIHRLMHHPALFKTIHLIHHKSTNPSPWTAYAFHPIEAILESGIVVLIALTIPIHISAFIIFMSFQIMYNVYGHLGYELYPKGFNKTKIGKWINTGTAHNQHHKLFKGNYGLYTLLWDRWMGTMREDYDKTFEEVREK